MNWRDYELYITKHFQRLFPNTSIRHDVKQDGLISRVKRQIDILIEGRIAGFELKIIIDCKYFNKKVDVKAVESFLSFLQDLKASKGILITNKGFSAAAKNRATFDTQDIELRIIDFSDLADFQNFAALPYSGVHGAFVTAPDGWVVDGAPLGNFLCSFYPAGLSQQEAFHTEGFIYLLFSHKSQSLPTLAALTTFQDDRLNYRNPKIEYITTKVQREDCKVSMRVIDAQEMNNTIEYTIFLDYRETVIFMTLLTPRSKQKDYLRKLEWIVEKLTKGNIIYNQAGKPINANL
jgi:hypothetical protein